LPGNSWTVGKTKPQTTVAVVPETPPRGDRARRTRQDGNDQGITREQPRINQGITKE